MNARDMLAFSIGVRVGEDQGRRSGFKQGHLAGCKSLQEAAKALGLSDAFDQIVVTALTIETERLNDDIRKTMVLGRSVERKQV